VDVAVYNTSASSTLPNIETIQAKHRLTDSATPRPCIDHLDHLYRSTSYLSPSPTLSLAQAWNRRTQTDQVHSQQTASALSGLYTPPCAVSLSPSRVLCLSRNPDRRGCTLVESVRAVGQTACRRVESRWAESGGTNWLDKVDCQKAVVW
jgi:hypothetical protein